MTGEVVSSLAGRNGRHNVVCSIEYDQITDYQQEWYRDLGCDWDETNQTYLKTGCERSILDIPRPLTGKYTLYASLQLGQSLFHQRFPKKKVGMLPVVPKKQIDGKPVHRHNRREEWRGPSYWDQSSQASEQPVRDFLQTNIGKAFRPEFASIKPLSTRYGDYRELHRRGMAFMQSEEGKRLRTLFLDKQEYEVEELLDYGIAKRLTGQNAGSLRLCYLLNALGRAIVGITYKNLIHLVGPRDGESRSRETMDIVILKEGRREIGNYDREGIAAVVEGRAYPSDDINLPEVVLQFMKHIRLAIGGTPLCGTAFGFTWCGHRLRYWTVNPDEYRSSRLIDLKKDCHLSEFIDMVILLVGPMERLLTSWQPGSELVLIKPGTSCPAWLGTWQPKGDTGGIMIRRDEPIGTRTAVWRGSFVEKAAEPPLDIIVKASWLSDEMRLHEYKILDLLLNDNASVHFPQKYAEDQDHLEDRFGVHNHMAGFADEAAILRRLPQLLGVVDDPHASLPGIQGIKLSFLVTRGPADMTIDKANLTGKQLMKVIADVFEILWYLSCRGVHYRDLNFGNILVRIDPNSGEYVGVLIDFGNATYAAERRRLPETADELKQAHLDDGRSANAYFMCLRSFNSRHLTEAVDQAEKIHQRRLKEMVPGVEDLLKQKRLQESERRLATARANLLKSSLHRYIDDLESAIYCVCYLMGSNLRREPLKLSDETEKKKYWDSDMANLFDYVDPENRYELLSDAVMSVTQVIRSAQKEIALMDDLSIEITLIEYEAFQRCTQIMRDMAASVPVDAPENSSWTVPAYEDDASWMVPADAAEDSSLDCE